MGAKKEGEILALQDYEVGLVRTLSIYDSRHLEGKVTLSFFYTSISSDDFNDFSVSARGEHLGKQYRYYSAPDFPQRTTLSSPEPPTSHALADSFHKRAKRDPDLFHKLKYNTQCDQYHIHMRATDRAKNVVNFLYLNYAPMDEDLNELFEEQKSIYAHFLNKLYSPIKENQ